MNKYFILLFLSCFSFFGKAQKDVQTTRILFIVDASNSMNGFWNNQPKIVVARKLMGQVLDSLNGIPNLQLGLRAFGNEKNYLAGQDCSDMQLIVPIASNSANRIKAAMNDKIRPRGTTIIAGSLEQCANDFRSCPTGNCKNVVILLTDGEEECEGDPCAVSRALQSQNIFLKPFIIGVGLDESAKQSFNCVGNYYDATDERRFKEVLGIVISQALNNTSVQVNLLDQGDAPTETNVNMTFYDHHSDQVVYNYVHTMNSRGNPDTLSLDPVHTYRIVAQTIPPQSIDSVVITPGKHNIVGIKTPQGTLEFKMAGVNLESASIPVIIREKDKMNTLNVQMFGELTRYITGNYDLEILTLPRTYINDINISQNHTTTIEIPQPGIATFMMSARGYGSVYKQTSKGLEFVTNLSQNKDKETLSLQPGDYVSVFRPKQARESIFTVERPFKIVSGASVAIKLN